MRLKAIFSIKNMLRQAFLLACLLLVFGAPKETLARNYAAIIVDDATGKTLYHRAADLPRYPASLTKLMTAYLVFEALDQGHVKMNDMVIVSSKAARQPASKLYLKQGDGLSIENALNALIIKSANDVAVALGEHLAGSEQNFARDMTSKARQLGLRNTQFENASGLHDKNQITTARDMAKLARRLLADFPHYAGYFKNDRFTFRGTTFYTHNRLMRQVDAIQGMKTGYTNAAGYNLISLYQKGGKNLIGVVMGGKTAGQRDRQMARLLKKYIAHAQTADLSDMSAPLVANTVRQPVFKSRPTGANRNHPFYTTDSKVTNWRIGGYLVDQAQTDQDPLMAVLKQGWSIQIGAFTRQSDARRQLEKAREQMPDLLASAAPHMMSVSTRGGVFYRARYRNFDEAGAKSACLNLIEHGMDCQALAP
ncbi:MAG: serine hydrolase [Parvibaculales bacterium]